MKTDSIINAFTVGEISPRLAGRTDIQQYYQSCSELLNMVVEFYGGAKKTPGTYFVNEVKSSAKQTRLKRFVFSDTQAYILEFGDQYIRFYKNNGQIIHTTLTASGWVTSTGYVVGNFVNSNGVIYYCVTAHTSGTFATDLAAGKWVVQSAYEIPTSYLEADIWELQFAQKEDVLYITHPDYPQAELTRTGHTAWTLTAIDYSVTPARPALMDPNITTTTITLTDASHPAVTLTASASLFDTTSPSLHIGSIWKVNSAKSVSAPDWETDTAYTTANYVNFNDEVYFCASNHTSGASFSVDLAAGKWSLQDLYIKITAVASATSASGTILYGSKLEASSAATTNWQEGSWSKKRGYPKSVTLYESRLVYGYTNFQPQTTWESKTASYKTFNLGTQLDTDAMSFKADTNEVEVINWIFPANEILIGTVSGLHTLGTGSDSVALTPTSSRIKKKSRDGVSSVMPYQIGNYVYYWQKYTRILREYAYSLDVDNFNTNDATAFAEHISASGIVDMDYQQSPLSVLWSVRADGKLISFTRQIEQKVAGWAQHDTQGLYKSVAVIPKTSYDEIWFIVERTINGATKKYIEYMVAPEFVDQEDAFFVHSGLTLDAPFTITNITAATPPVVTCTNTLTDGDIIKIRGVVGMTEVNNKKYKVAGRAAGSFHLHDLAGNNVVGAGYTAYVSGGEARDCVSTLTGLSHLEGKTVQILADGANHPNRVVTSGEVTLDDSYSQINVGLGYTGRLTTNDYEPAPGKRAAQGRIKRIANILVNLYKSLGCRVGATADLMDNIVFRTSAMPTDQAPALFTGIKEISFPSGWDREKKVIIEQTQPLPLHVLSIIIEGEIS